MAFADVLNVEARLGRPLTNGETTQAGEWIADLESDIRLRISDVDDRIIDPNYARTVKRVIAEAVADKLRNPKGLRQRTVSVDDYSETEVVDSAKSSGRLELSDADWALLLPATNSDAFSIRAIPDPGYAF